MKKSTAYFLFSLTAAIALFVVPVGYSLAAEGLNPVVSYALPTAALYVINKITPHLFTLKPSDYHLGAIQNEIWSKHLIENYWANNAWAKLAHQVAKEYIYGGKVVHIPAVNGRPEVVVNPTVFPIEPTDREDTDVLYLIDGHFVKPFRIPRADQHELNYDKRQSVIGEQSAAANNSAAIWHLYRWAKYIQTNDDGSTTTMRAMIERTTGANVAPHLAGATGTRKLPLVADFKRAKVRLNNLDVPAEGRICVIDSNMLDQLTQDDEYKKSEKVYEKELIDGTVARVQGFNIFERSSVLKFSQDATTPEPYSPSAPPAGGSVAEDEQNAGAILFHPWGVETAMGEVEFFDATNDPRFYGDIYSAMLRSGGRIRRADSVVTLIQDPGV